MARTFNTNLKNTANYYTRLLNLRITSSTLQKDIEEHPFYPSLFSLSDTFDLYHVKNNGYRIKRDEFEQLDTPFIALMNFPKVGKDFAVVTKISSEKISYVYKNKKVTTTAKEEFLKNL